MGVIPRPPGPQTHQRRRLLFVYKNKNIPSVEQKRVVQVGGNRLNHTAIKGMMDTFGNCQRPVFLHDVCIIQQTGENLG